MPFQQMVLEHLAIHMEKESGPLSHMKQKWAQSCHRPKHKRINLCDPGFLDTNTKNSTKKPKKK